MCPSLSSVILAWGSRHLILPRKPLVHTEQAGLAFSKWFSTQKKGLEGHNLHELGAWPPWGKQMAQPGR